MKENLSLKTFWNSGKRLLNANFQVWKPDSKLIIITVYINFSRFFRIKIDISQWLKDKSAKYQKIKQFNQN